MSAFVLVPWRIYDGAPLLSLPCGHEVFVKPEWLSATGRFIGRLACTVSGCRRVLDAVRLEGYAHE